MKMTGSFIVAMTIVFASACGTGNKSSDPITFDDQAQSEDSKSKKKSIKLRDN